MEPDHAEALAALRDAGVWQPGSGGPSGSPQRLELLCYLLERGASPDQITSALGRGDIQGLGFDLLIEVDDLSLDELADAVGIDPEELCLLYRHLGVEIRDLSAARFGSDEVDFIRRLRQILAVFPREAGDEIMQTMGAAMSAMAAASISAFVGSVEPGLADQGDELAWTRIITDAGAGALDLVSDLRGIFRHHLRIAIDRQRSSMRDVESRLLSTLAVGFVDLVGYTSATEQMPAEQLVAYTGRFRHRAHDVVTSEGGRVVKHIGDEVMFSALEPSLACRIGRALIEAFSESESLPRGAIAYGQLVARHGDLYGPVVNMASRLADIAVPGELLAPSSLSDHLPMEGVTLAPAGRRQLKGFSSPVEVVSVD